MARGLIGVPLPATKPPTVFCSSSPLSVGGRPSVSEFHPLFYNMFNSLIDLMDSQI